MRVFGGGQLPGVKAGGGQNEGAAEEEGAAKTGAAKTKGARGRQKELVNKKGRKFLVKHTKFRKSGTIHQNVLLLGR